MLGRVKGRVLAVLAMLAPKEGRCAWLRAAPLPAPCSKKGRDALDPSPVRPGAAEVVGTKGVPVIDLASSGLNKPPALENPVV